MMASLSDDPDMWRRPPMQPILDACYSAKYGDDDGDRDWLSPSTTPF